MGNHRQRKRCGSRQEVLMKSHQSIDLPDFAISLLR